MCTNNSNANCVSEKEYLPLASLKLSETTNSFEL